MSPANANNSSNAKLVSENGHVTLTIETPTIDASMTPSRRQKFCQQSTSLFLLRQSRHVRPPPTHPPAQITRVCRRRYRENDSYPAKIPRQLSKMTFPRDPPTSFDTFCFESYVKCFIFFLFFFLDLRWERDLY